MPEGEADRRPTRAPGEGASPPRARESAPERHADADLVGSLAHGEGDQAREAGGGDGEGEGGERAEEHGDEPRRGDRLVPDLLQGPDVGDRGLRIERVDRLPDAVGQDAGGRPRCARSSCTSTRGTGGRARTGCPWASRRGRCCARRPRRPRRPPGLAAVVGDRAGRWDRRRPSSDARGPGSRWPPAGVFDPVVLVEGAASKQGHPDGVEVVRACAPVLGLGQGLTVAHGPAFDLEGVVVAEAAVQGEGPGRADPERRRASPSSSRTRDSWKARTRSRSVRCPSSVYFDQLRSMLMVSTFSARKPASTRLQLGKAPQGEGGADQEDEGEGELGHDEGPAQPAAAGARRGPAALAEGPREPRPGGQAGQRARDDARGQDTSRVKARTQPSRLTSVARGVNRAAKVESRRAPAAASNRPSAPPARARIVLSVRSCRTRRLRPRAERGPHRELALAAREPRDDQVGDVRAGDQEHEGRRSRAGRGTGAAPPGPAPRGRAADRRGSRPWDRRRGTGLRRRSAITPISAFAWARGTPGLHPREGLQHARLAVLGHRGARAEGAGRGGMNTSFASG